MATAQRKKPQVIECGKSYSLAEFREIVGCSYTSLQLMRDKGLKVCCIDRKRHWINGDDWHDYLKSLPSVDA